LIKRILQPIIKFFGTLSGTYNPEKKTIKGTFALSLLREWSNPENSNTTLSFTNGLFKGTIIN